MVLDEGKPNLFEAVCCSVEVLKTGLEGLFLFLLSTLLILKALESLLRISLASVSLAIFISSFLYLNKSASKSLKIPVILQYSSGLKASISRSLSTISFKATDWTRPALLPPVLDCINFDNLKPMIRSSILLVSCDLTIGISILRGSLKASSIAGFVTSWNTTRSYLSSGISKASYKCHEIASPSRSGSLARYTLSAFLASLFNSLIVFALPFIGT